jgi:AraC family transcriptional regulator of adaptative response / DNA-3-methyladenine glycosylase II
MFPLTLGYRAPFAWEALLAFLAARAARGVEAVDGGTYLRTARVGPHVGWLRARHLPEQNAVRVEVSPSLAPSLLPLAARLRRLFDLDARPREVDAHLARDPDLRAHVRRVPGLRVPGAVDAFEVAVRAILGQRVSVRAATTLACRLAEAYGEPIETPYPALLRLPVTAERIAAAPERELATLGIPEARARTLSLLAHEVATGRLGLDSIDATVDPDATVASLLRLRGVGPWTARYVAMRALGAPDAFPSGDAALCNALATSAQALEERAAAWRPWRAYAAMHLYSLPKPGIVGGIA